MKHRAFLIFLFSILAMGSARAEFKIQDWKEPNEPNFCETHTESTIRTNANFRKTKTEGENCIDCYAPTVATYGGEHPTTPTDKQNICRQPAGTSEISAGCFCLAEEAQRKTGQSRDYIRLECPGTGGMSANGEPDYHAKTLGRSCDNNGRIAGALAASFNAVVKCLNSKVSNLAAQHSGVIPDHTNLKQILIDPSDAFKLINHESQFVMNERKGGMMQLTRVAVQEIESGPAYSNRSGRTHNGLAATLQTSATYTMWHTPSNDPSCQEIESGPHGIPGNSQRQIPFGNQLTANNPDSECPLLDPTNNPDRAFVYGLSLYVAGKQEALKWMNERRAQLHRLGFSEGDIAKLETEFTALDYNMGPGAKKVFDQYMNMLPRVIGQNQQTGAAYIEAPEDLVGDQVQEIKTEAKSNPSLWNKLFGFISKIKSTQETRAIAVQINQKSARDPNSVQLHQEVVNLSSAMIEKVAAGGSLTDIKNKAIRERLEATILAGLNTMSPIQAAPHTKTAASESMIAKTTGAVNKVIQLISRAAEIQKPAGSPEYLSNMARDDQSFQRRKVIEELKGSEGYTCNLK